jgi:aspartate-semialdehyde dehydrogenase
MKKYSIAIVGVDSIVGNEILHILEQREFPISFLRLLAADSPEGKTLKFSGQDTPLEELTHDAFRNIDIAFFTAGVDVTRHFARTAVKDGVFVIDNSDEYRLDSDYPLVVPEVNVEDIREHQGIIVNPSSHVIQTVMALYPLEKSNHIIRATIVTHHPVSDLGYAANDELTLESRQAMEGQKVVPHVFQHQLAFNLLPQVDVFYESGYSREEMRLINESRKIMHVENISISATCVRVPVYSGLSEAIHIEFASKTSEDEIRNILREWPGIRIEDDLTIGLYPQPLLVTGTDEIFIGRIRQDILNPNGIAMWVVADNIRKGAALNMIQIAEETVKRNWLTS